MAAAPSQAGRTGGGHTPGIYRHFAGDALLYLGITEHPNRRQQQHAADKWWMPHVTHTTWQWFPNVDRRHVETIEAHYIRTERPAFNRHHNPNPQTPPPHVKP